VTSNVSKPAVAARLITSVDRSRSFHMYSWNQLRPSGLAAATSSGVAVPTVDSEKGMPAAPAAAAPARSPAVCIMRVNPVGAMPNGNAEGPPVTVHDVSTTDTSRRMLGWNSMSRNAWRARSSDSSCSAAPSV
jgi:hypothetical protein